MKYINPIPKHVLILICAAALHAQLAPARAVTVSVTVQNLAPINGTFLTPVWVGFHDGTFDVYDAGAAASPELERLAEDGSTGPLSAAFAASGVGAADGTLGGGPIAPGATVSSMFNLDPNAPASRYFSYASMVIPSNDAFIGNGNELAFPIFDAGGNFLGADFIVLGSMVRDAGTEVNDEVPANTAFFGQAAPNTGVDENGVVHDHAGFLAAGSGGILDAAMFAAADFKAQGYQVARVSVRVPETLPAGSLFTLAAFGLLGMKWVRRFSVV